MRAPTRTSRIAAVVFVAVGFTTTSARMNARLTSGDGFAAELGPDVGVGRVISPV